jgi:hypothetical protein
MPLCVDMREFYSGVNWFCHIYLGLESRANKIQKKIDIFFRRPKMPQAARVWWFTLLSVLLSVSAPGALAQTAVDGAVGGTVADASGAIVSGATVTVLENATNAEQKTIADGAGYFRVIHLQPGTYTVTISAPGFEPYKSVGAIVQVGLLTTIDAHMQVGSTAQTVEVTGAAPLVNTTNPDFAGVVDQKEFCTTCRSVTIAGLVTRS